MGKRPRTPHFITGGGEENANLPVVADRKVAGGDDIFVAGGSAATTNTGAISKAISTGATRTGSAPHIRSRNERWIRMEDPPGADHWKDVFGGSTDNLGRAPVAGGPWQVSAFALLGMIVVLSAIFLHLLAESSNGSDSHHHSNNHYYHQRRRQRQQRRMYKTRKKKTDEWSDDEEELQNGAQLLGSIVASSSGGGTNNNAPSSTSPARVEAVSHRHYQNVYPFYYHQPPQHNPYVPRFAVQQEHRHRRPKEPITPTSTNTSNTNNSNYYMQSPGHQGVVPTYRSPSTTLKNLTNRSPNYSNKPITAINAGRRAIGASSSFSNHGTPSPGVVGFTGTTANPPLSGRLRMPHPHDGSGNFPTNSHNQQNGFDTFATSASSSSSTAPNHKGRLPTPPEGAQLLVHPPYMPAAGATEPKFNLTVRPLNVSVSNVSSFNSSSPADGSTQQDHESKGPRHLAIHNSQSPSSEQSANLSQLVGTKSSLQNRGHDSFDFATEDRGGTSCQNLNRSTHHDSLALSPGFAYEDTPRVGNGRRMLQVDDAKLVPQTQENEQKNQPKQIIEQSPKNDSYNSLDKDDKAFAQPPQAQSEIQIPMIPSLSYVKLKPPTSNQSEVKTPQPPPRSVLMDELRLVQMETGNAKHWEHQANPTDGSKQSTSESNSRGDKQRRESANADVKKADHESPSASFASESSVLTDDLSIPSGDPRKSILHKRDHLDQYTDAASSLQSSIQFDELQLQEVIGGGGFGQVWRATWRSTPVAVKVLTGSAQAKHIARAILEEFRAEINLLKGMRHPNICLYMGACVDPPNRAIITELAANGSVWDALRLPLMPPFAPADGTHRGSWPVHLYLPNQHGVPPTHHGRKDMSVLRITSPIPPKGTWPWELVKRVACGAARGMAYLHSGNPPVLHRDLKSANLLLDESYTTKVCDFGLSRLKAQERSMTGNCGTVQWMAPEVLANRKYNEKADVYSFGIICWELLTRECPYDGMNAIQCALAVLNRDKRPEIPKWCPPSLHALIKACVKQEPKERPTFAQILLALDAMS